MADFTRTLERAQKIDFTDPYVVAGETLLVKKESGIKSITDLAGKTVTVVKGGTGSIAVKKLCPDAEIREFDTAADCVTAVKNGQADAFAEDSNLITYQAKMNPDLEEVGESIVTLEYNAFGVNKNDQEWLNYMNLFVYEMNRTGKNAELYQKWFGKELPFELNPGF
jgi:polar amino acid transport system substrate-binding protein